ncbi:MAG: hypothetical protein IT223_01515 [Crocinitomicaceae bacterium]|nr:hypothetical protein [Crocinitomicaceae bacterium]
MTETKNTFQKSDRRKRRLRVFLINATAILGAFSLFGLLGFVSKKQKNTVCWSVEITVAPVKGESFIDEKDLQKSVFIANDSIVGKKISEVDIAGIYHRVMTNPFVRQANVFTTVDGRCIVNATQRMPIARILNADGSGFYLDSEGFTVPLSHLHTARVPIFTGYLNEKQTKMPVVGVFTDSLQRASSKLDDIFQFVQYINENEFIKAQVEHVYIDDRGNFEIIPRVGNHRISIGKVENLDQKFKKLMAFYANVLNNRDLNIYRKINLEFDGQVVCVK